jgi:hypothetical protein
LATQIYEQEQIVEMGRVHPCLFRYSRAQLLIVSLWPVATFALLYIAIQYRPFLVPGILGALALGCIGYLIQAAFIPDAMNAVAASWRNGFRVIWVDGDTLYFVGQKIPIAEVDRLEHQRRFGFGDFILHHGNGQQCYHPEIAIKPQAKPPFLHRP